VRIVLEALGVIMSTLKRCSFTFGADVAQSAVEPIDPDSDASLEPSSETPVVPPAVDLLIEQLSRGLVGCVGLKEAQHHLRVAMIAEALRRTAGSRRAAAFLLGVDRAYVRRIARGEH
jgi:hypothetical protein